MSNDDSYVEVAKVDEIPSGKMKHVEVNGKEIMIANLDGKFYALNDRCSHTNAPLSMGNIQGSIVTCPCMGLDLILRQEGRYQIQNSHLLKLSLCQLICKSTWNMVVDFCLKSKHTIRKRMKLKSKAIASR